MHDLRRTSLAARILMQRGVARFSLRLLSVGTQRRQRASGLGRMLECLRISARAPVAVNQLPVLIVGLLASGLDGERADAESTSDAESESASDPKASSLWQLVSEKALLHATILRALRFGDQPPPGFQQQFQAAQQSKAVADQGRSEFSSATASASGPTSSNSIASRSDQSAEAGSVPVSPSPVQSSG